MSEQETIAGKLIRFLNETDPAKLIIWCALFLIIASVCGVIRFQIQTGLSWSESQRFLDSSQSNLSFVSDYQQENDRTGLVFVKNASVFVLGIGAFIFGIIGGLLPMWAVGRLIADAIRESPGTGDGR